jgi:hypothetical protein
MKDPATLDPSFYDCDEWECPNKAMFEITYKDIENRLREITQALCEHHVDHIRRSDHYQVIYLEEF